MIKNVAEVAENAKDITGVVGDVIGGETGQIVEQVGDVMMEKGE